MIEKIVSALRKSFLLVFFRNIWLFWIALVYSLLALVLIFGVTALPVVYWVAAGYHFDPGLLFSRPLEFILSHWLLIIYSLGGYTVGFILFLVVWLFYHGALTAVVTRAVGKLRSAETGRVDSGAFLKDGRTFLSKSAGTASLAGLLPLPTLVVLLAVGGILLIRMATDPTRILMPLSGVTILLMVVGALALVATVLLTILAVLWYRYSLCAVCADGLSVAQAMLVSLKFFGRCWHGVLGLVLASILLSMAFSGLALPINYGIGLIGNFSEMLELFLKLPGYLLSTVVGVGFDLWMKAALVVFYIENREPDVRRTIKAQREMTFMVKPGE